MNPGVLAAKRFLIAVLCVVAVLPSARADDDFKVVKCDATAAAEITEAYRFVTSNKSKVFNPMSYLTSNQRDEMKEKWGRVTVECIDDKRTCVNKSGKGGHAHSGIGNRVNVCYYNHVGAGLSQCDLVNTLVHEEGHANGMPKMKGHDNPTPAIKASDLVYRMGNDAQAFCEAEATAGRFVDAVLRGRESLALGKSCAKDDQCGSGKCERNQCVCKNDNDCGSQKCRKPLGGINQCRP